MPTGNYTAMHSDKVLSFQVMRKIQEPIMNFYGPGRAVFLILLPSREVFRVAKFMVSQKTFVPMSVYVLDDSDRIRPFIDKIPKENHPILRSWSEFVHKFPELFDASMNVSDEDGTWSHTMIVVSNEVIFK